MIQKVITIAGSDSSGGGGIQADLKTFEEYGTFGFTAITSFVTMDPSQNWAHTITPVDNHLVEQQLASIYAGAPLAAAKTGMLGSPTIIAIIADYFKHFQQKNIVIDPVIISKGTNQLLQPENVSALKEKLLPYAAVTTPNLIEAAILADMTEIETKDKMKEAAERIYQLGPKNVVIKGGRRFPSEQALDLWYTGSEFIWMANEKINTPFNHGAGCTFAAAITAGLAKGFSMEIAIKQAKKFVFAAIQAGFPINPYLGHVWHGAFNQAEKRMPSTKEKRR